MKQTVTILFTSLILVMICLTGCQTVDQAKISAASFGAGAVLYHNDAGIRFQPANTSREKEIDKIIFIKRPTYNSSHYYTDFIDGMEDFEFGEDIGNLYILDLTNDGLTELVPELNGGVFGRFDLSFDAQKVVFDYKPSQDKGFRIWEVGVDGEGLRQLTFEPDDEQARIEKYDAGWEDYNKHTDDMHPCYLADGGIMFTSTRCEYEILCDEGYLTTAVLYRIDGDGGNMEKLTSSAVSEFSPVALSDGRVLYSRWEYVDKGSTSIKALWSMNPDGTGTNEVYGNNINQPPTFIFGREIPGTEGQFVAIGAPHFPQGTIGPVIKIDTRKDIRSREPMTYITPDLDIVDEPGWMFRKNDRWKFDPDGMSGKLYMDPYPLREDLYLVSCKYDHKAEWMDPAAYGIYLLDGEGNHSLVYDDPDISCWQAMPLEARAHPPVLNSLRMPEYAEKNLALCIVTDVYQGMERVERGTIKYLRINEQIPRPWGCNKMTLEGRPNYWDPAEDPVVSAEGAFAVRLQHGIVPVEDDGSAYFTVPADRNIFFQALDENYMEVQRERTYVNYRPGEVRACIGCHERQDRVPAQVNASNVPLALLREPSTPGPQPGELNGTRVLHYITDVQPVWDKHCISCHHDGEDTESFSLTGELTEVFCESYLNLIGEDYVRIIYEDRKGGQADGEYMPPYSLGAHASELKEYLGKEHFGVELSREEMIRVTTWMDANGQYYGSYYGRINSEHVGHPNFRPVPTVEQALSPLPPVPQDKR